MSLLLLERFKPRRNFDARDHSLERTIRESCLLWKKSANASNQRGRWPFSQTTASPWFNAQGNFAGQTISDVAGQLRDGTLSAMDVPVQTVTMDGNTLIV